jgi:hypothetical protein
MSEYPQWYLDEALPRLKRLDDLSPIAYPSQLPPTPRGRERMHEARREWDRLIKEQLDAEIAACL